MKLPMWMLPAWLLLTACSAREAKLDALEVAGEAAPAVAYTPPVPEGGSAEEESAGDAPNSDGANTRVTAAPTASRKLIYHAEVHVKVDDLARANARMDSLTRAFGAYVSDASETREDGQWEHKTTIRVLPTRFQAMLGSLNGLGELQSKTLSTDDVTAEHADVSARLATKRALEQRYVALLKQAKKVSDILEIEGKIGEVRGDIEATESKLKTLNDQVAYSTITLTYFQEISLRTPDAPVLSFGSRLVEAFYNGWELLTGLVLALVTAWPLLVLGAGGVWVLRAWRQRRRQRAAANSDRV